VAINGHIKSHKIGDNMAKFKIVKGREFKCTFIIKEPGSPDPVELIVGDTGSFILSTYGPAPSILLEVNMALGTLEDNANGKMFLTLTAEETALLPSDVQFGEDGFPLHPTCQALLDITSVVTGKIYAQVPQIYVVDIGD